MKTQPSRRGTVHPSKLKCEPQATTKARSRGRLTIPTDRDHAELDVAGCVVRLTNLRKPFWPELGITKGDLLQYYADVSPVLLPHLINRAMVMKRYPNGAAGEFFFMKHAPEHRPDWIQICSIAHDSGNIIDFAIVQDLRRCSGSSISAAST